MSPAKSLRLLFCIGLVLLPVGCTRPIVTSAPVVATVSLPSLLPATAPVQSTPAAAAAVGFILQPPNDQDAGVDGLAFSPDGSLLAAGYESGDVILWDTNTHQTIRSFRGEGGTGGLAAMSGMAFTLDGKLLASVSHANGLTVTLWDVAEGQAIDVVKDLAHGDGMALSPDGKLLAYGKCAQPGVGSHCSEYEIVLWDVAARQPAGPSLRFRVGAAAPLGLLFSPDGRILAALSSATTGSGKVELFDVATRRSIASPLGGEDPFTSMAFDPSGKSLALANTPGAITFWTIESRQVSFHLIGDRCLVTNMGFRPDGTMLASLFLIPSSESMPRQKILLWDLKTLQPVGEPLAAQAALGREAEFMSFAFSPDGRILASGTDDGAIVLWDLTGP